MLNRNRENFLLAAALLLAIALAPMLRAEGRRIAAQTHALSAVPGSVEARNTNAFARILGEVRLGAADFLFVKTELYLHGGIGYHAHVDDLDASVAEAPSRPEPAHHHGHDHDHGPRLEPAPDDLAPERLTAGSAHDNAGGDGVATRIRTRDEDFRGFLGHLEREIKPWRDPEAPHILTGGTELLPWFRIMTIANPHFVRAYRVGAMWLGRENRHDAALAYLQEGIDANADNPELFQLYLSKVLMLLRQGRIDGTPTGPAAIEAARDGLAAGLLYRPQHGEIGAIRHGLLWTADHEEDLLFLARFVVMLLERERRFDEAIAAGRDALVHFPDDETLRRLVKRLDSGTRP
jgi:hypothetical protein